MLQSSIPLFLGALGVVMAIAFVVLSIRRHSLVPMVVSVIGLTFALFALVLA